MRNLPPLRPRGLGEIGTVQGGIVRATPEFLAFFEQLQRAMQADVPPPGVLWAYMGLDAPDGWLLANGAFVNKGTYAALFGVIGTRYGEDGDNFRLPDLRDRIPIGAGAYASLLNYGGSGTATLSIDNLPPHAHDITDPGHSHTATSDPHTHDFTSDPYTPIITDPGHIHTTTEPNHSHSHHNHVGVTRVATAVAPDGVNVADPKFASSTGVATTGLTVDSATTGITIDDIEVTGTTDETALDLTVSTEFTGVTVNATGGGEAFNIIPPVFGANILIKT